MTQRRAGPTAAAAPDLARSPPGCWHRRAVQSHNNINILPPLAPAASSRFVPLSLDERRAQITALGSETGFLDGTAIVRLPNSCLAV